MARIFYRVIKNQRPQVEDFWSDASWGEPLPVDPHQIELQDGISVFNTEQQARRKAEAYPVLGAYIAAVEFAEDAPITYRRTLTTRGITRSGAMPHIFAAE